MRITESDFIRRTTATDYAKTTWYKLGRWNLSVILRRAMLKVAFGKTVDFALYLTTWLTFHLILARVV